MHKKSLIALVMALMLTIFFASSAYADITVYKKHARTGGGADALDGIDGATLVDGSMAFVIESDWTYFYENDADGSLPENNPSVIVADANPGTNCWKLKWKGATNPLIENGTDQTVTGKQNRIGLNSNTGVTFYGGPALGGVTVFNTYITGVTNPARPPTSGITIFVLPPAGGENWWVLNRDDTAVNGTTLFVVPTAGVTVISNTACTGGASKYVVAGSPLENGLLFTADEAGTSTYLVRRWGTVSVEAD